MERGVGMRRKRYSPLAAAHDVPEGAARGAGGEDSHHLRLVGGLVGLVLDHVLGLLAEGGTIEDRPCGRSSALAAVEVAGSSGYDGGQGGGSGEDGRELHLDGLFDLCRREG